MSEELRVPVNNKAFNEYPRPAQTLQGPVFMIYESVICKKTIIMFFLFKF